ncbi:hypothetical protein [Gordonia amicalis]|uniref:hypothetical protein n=1 Tax=Gordonia amicalis TaxID=89053 RepID=UPI0015F52A51|nr:hypothetical protein [Gordonia amicalis]MBA5846288.1 hypothetical protein [Gordonia amicalis]
MLLGQPSHFHGIDFARVETGVRLLASNLVKRLIAGALIAGAATFGLVAGAGDSDAKIKEGRYKHQLLMYGVVPTPESNARVIGNTYQQDYYGVGPANVYQYSIRPTKNGGVASYSSHPAVEWYYRTEYRRTKNGYVGTTYNFGVPIGNMLLKAQPKGR